MLGINFEKKAPAKQENVETGSVEKSPEMAEAIKEYEEVIGDISKMSESEAKEAFKKPGVIAFFKKHAVLFSAGGLALTGAALALTVSAPAGIAVGVFSLATFLGGLQKEEDIKTTSGGPYFNSPG